MFIIRTPDKLENYYEGIRINITMYRMHCYDVFESIL